MGYDTHTPTKEVWLPLDYPWLYDAIAPSPMPLAQFNEIYKKKYGIDLISLISLNDSYIALVGNIVSYAVDDNYVNKGIVDKIPLYVGGSYTSGENDAISYILVGLKGRDEHLIGGFGIEFKIDKNSELSIENIVVQPAEI